MDMEASEKCSKGGGGRMGGREGHDDKYCNKCNAVMPVGHSSDRPVSHSLIINRQRT